MENVYKFRDPSAIDEAAATWLIRLEGDQSLEPEDMHEFRTWLAQSPSHQQAFKRISSYWQEDEVLAELAVPLSKPTIKRRSVLAAWLKGLQLQLPGGVVVLACSLAACAILFVQIVGFDFDTRLENGTYKTEVGKQQDYMLADGSIILLNTDTQVRIEYSALRRKIFLLQGEAHFDVVADASRPFEVYAGDGMVRAVGTAFSVYLTDEREVEVIVSEGKVDLSAVTYNELPAHAPSELQQTRAPVAKLLGSLEAGQNTVFDQDIGTVTRLQKLELRQELSWQTGLLIFKGEPLSEVVKEINRYTALTVEIVDPALENLEIGGRFKVEEVEGIFDVLEVNFGVQVSRINDQLVRLQLANSK